MGAAFMRNRHWWYRSLYDDYIGREMRLSFSIASVIWIPHYAYGCFLNRKVEENYATRAYSLEWGPRRNRLTHSLVLEEFEQVLENWEDLNTEYAQKGNAMLKEAQ